MNTWRSQPADSLLEEAYARFIYRFELETLRRVYFTGAALNVAFVVVDYLRNTDFFWVAVFRTIMISLVLATALWTYVGAITSARLRIVTLTSSSLYLILGFFLDFRGNMPDFFMPNFILLMVYIFNAALGYNFHWKLWQNILLLTAYCVYCFYPQGNAFHQSQIINVTLNVIMAGFIGYLIEHYKRRSFIQQKRLAEAKQEVEGLSHFKNKIISILSHDLNSPLNSLAGLLHLHKQNNITQDEFNKLLPSVERSLDSATFMLDTLLRWSKTQLDGFQPSFETTPLRQLCQNVVQGVGSLPDDKKITVINNVPENLVINTDQQLVSLAVRNLLVNSIKFSNPNTTVTLTSEKHAAEAWLSIRDEGVGMSAEEVEKLFTVRKKSLAGTKLETGTGLGLILVKEFLQKINASITVASTPGAGTTFTLRLPAH